MRPPRASTLGLKASPHALSLLLFALTACGVRPSVVHAQGRTMLVGATVYDGTERGPIQGARIAIRDGLIDCISGPEGCPARADDVIRNLTGYWITPGLIDAHAHLFPSAATETARREQRLRFALGITAVRDAGALYIDEAVNLREESRDPRVPMPRVVVAGRVDPDQVVLMDTERGAGLVARVAAMGVDAIKTKGPFVGPVWLDEVRAAQAAGIPIYGHTWDPEVSVTQEAVEAGFAGVTHLMAFPPRAQPVPGDLQIGDYPSESAFVAARDSLWLTAEPSRLDTIMTSMIRAGAWLEPTLLLEFYRVRPVEPPAIPWFLDRPPYLREMLTGRSPADTMPSFPAAYSRKEQFVADFVAKGGVVVAGSDRLRPAVDLHEEMRLISRAVGSPVAGLVAATSNAAKAIGRADLGSLEANKAADMVLYLSDPFARPLGTLDVSEVVKGGVAYTSDELTAEFRGEYRMAAREVWLTRLTRWGPYLVFLLMAAAVGLVLVVVRLRQRRQRAMSAQVQTPGEGSGERGRFGLRAPLRSAPRPLRRR